MRALLGTLLIFGIICTFLLVLGAGIGFLLYWLLPGIDLGIGMLIGVIAIGFTAQLFARISSMPLDDPLDDPSFGEPFTSQRITYLIDPTPPQRRRKRKQNGARNTSEPA
jgi:hypothetical protein